MFINSKHINKLLVLASVLVLFFNRANAQEVRVVDKKGTIQSINNNNVTTATTAPLSPVENDIWFDSNSTPNEINIWDGTIWKNISTTIAHTGTAGSIFFANSLGGAPTENNSQLFWDNTTNSLGVGTNTPSNKFHVTGAIRSQGMLNSNGNANEPSYRFNEDTNTGMYRIAADRLGFSSGGTLALEIDASQNVSVENNLTVTGSYIDSSGDTGTSGQILSSTVTGTNWIDPIIVTVNNKTADYTLILSDNGKVLTFDSLTDVILTVPNGLPIGYNVSIYQTNTGKVTVQGGATILNRLSRFKTAGKDAGAGLVATATNIFHLTGDLKR